MGGRKCCAMPDCSRLGKNRHKKNAERKVGKEVEW